jgi:glucosamine-6-phosphate deaminase
MNMDECSGIIYNSFMGGTYMRICICEDDKDLGIHAARTGADRIRKALAESDVVSIIVATGASQFTMLEALAAERGIDWSRVEVFHLDEYVGLHATHPASFRKYLKERFADKVGPLNDFHYINADVEDLEGEVKRVGDLIMNRKITVAFIGIGENGHLAFNDPPADLTTEEPYLVVALDEACRRQQVGEGWFKTVADVPTHAVSMSIGQILKSECIVCSVPDGRKADAVHMALYAPIDAQHPAASLRTHRDCYLVVDRMAASKVLSR